MLLTDRVGSGVFVGSSVAWAITASGAGAVAFPPWGSLTSTAYCPAGRFAGIAARSVDASTAVVGSGPYPCSWTVVAPVKLLPDTVSVPGCPLVTWAGSMPVTVIAGTWFGGWPGSGLLDVGDAGGSS